MTSGFLGFRFALFPSEHFCLAVVFALMGLGKALDLNMILRCLAQLSPVRIADCFASVSPNIDEGRILREQESTSWRHHW
jgi:hypothetical protein